MWKVNEGWFITKIRTITFRIACLSHNLGMYASFNWFPNFSNIRSLPTKWKPFLYFISPLRKPSICVVSACQLSYPQPFFPPSLPKMSRKELIAVNKVTLILNWAGFFLNFLPLYLPSSVYFVLFFPLKRKLRRSGVIIFYKANQMRSDFR